MRRTLRRTPVAKRQVKLSSTRSRVRTQLLTQLCVPETLSFRSFDWFVFQAYVGRWSKPTEHRLKATRQKVIRVNTHTFICCYRERRRDNGRADVFAHTHTHMHRIDGSIRIVVGFQGVNRNFVIAAASSSLPACHIVLRTRCR